MTNIYSVCKDLLFDQPFYGTVLLSMDKEITERVPTAGVGLQGVMYKLYINPVFWESLSENHKRGLLIHELGHICFFHLTEYEHHKNHEISNIAKDIYINQLIPADLLPDGGCTWDKFPDSKLLPNKDTNWYYDKLMESAESNSDQVLQNCLDAMAAGEPQASDGQGNPMNLPQHDWEEVEEASDAIKKVLAKNTEKLLEETIKQCKDAPGSVPGNLKELLDKLSKIEPPKFNWKAFLKRFVGTSTKVDTRKTRRKKSKRFTGMPGIREMYYSNILVAIDTSASVNTEELKEFMNEIRHMHKTGHDIQIVMCDTEINHQFKYHPSKPVEVFGRGGTDFQPVIDLYNANLKKYSCLIYLTDGECRSPKGARGNILWVMSSVSQLNDSLPGKCIKLN